MRQIHCLQVITGVDADIPSSHPATASQIQSKIRSEYYGYVRRLPSNMHCEILLQIFFANINPINNALAEPIFREQMGRWRSLAYEILLTQGPEKLPDDLRFFPVLIFQTLAVALQFLSIPYDERLEELKFGPSQSFADLSREYSECGVALYKSLGKARPTLIGVQHGFLRDVWLTNKGDILQAWNHSGQTIK
jgi:hypothetical protein